MKDDRSDPVLTSPPGLIAAARGLRIRPRNSSAQAAEADLTVVDVRPVRLPEAAGLEALAVDGSLWRRLWSLADRLVVEFVDMVNVEVIDHDGSVVFDRFLAPDMEEHLLLDHVLPLVLARRGSIVLHAAVVGLGDRAVVLIGRSGAGKSTLTAFLGQRGWTVGGDDGAVLVMGDIVEAEPTYATIRLTPQAVSLLKMERTRVSDVAGKKRLAEDALTPLRQEPVPLACIAVLEPVPADQAAALNRIRGVQAHAALFGGAFHAELPQGSLLPAVVNGLADVVNVVPVARLAVPRGLPGLAQAELVLRQGLLR